MDEVRPVERTRSRPVTRTPVRVLRTRRLAAGAGASASLQTWAKRPIAVAVVNTSLIQSTGTRNDADKNAIPNKIMRSARSMSPPLAEMPNDSALARW